MNEVRIDNSLYGENPGLNRIAKVESPMSYGVMTPSLGAQAKMIHLVQLVKNVFLDAENGVTSNITFGSQPTGIKKYVNYTRGLYEIQQTKKHTVYSHSGRTYRHSAAMHFVPETGTGVIIMSNSETGTKDLSLQILRMINRNWKRNGKEK